MGWFILPNCGGGGGGGTPVDNMTDAEIEAAQRNAPHIIEFMQPAEYADGSSMSVPSVIGGYYLYVCHIQDGIILDPMVWVAEINTNPLNYDNNAWRGRWDILNILKNPELKGTRPNDTHAFSLRAVSTTLGPDGKPEVSPFSNPWVYGITPYPLDNSQIPREASPYAQHPSAPADMQFDINSGDK